MATCKMCFDNYDEKEFPNKDGLCPLCADDIEEEENEINEKTARRN